MSYTRSLVGQTKKTGFKLSFLKLRGQLCSNPPHKFAGVIGHAKASMRNLRPVEDARLEMARVRGAGYTWAGRFRRTRISKGTSAFCYPEHIAGEMRRLFLWLKQEQRFRDTSAADFAAKAAHFLAELNAIHPFREGKGRTQLTFLFMLASDAGHPLDLDRLDTDAVLDAMIQSFSGNEEPLRTLIQELIV